MADATTKPDPGPPLSPLRTTSGGAAPVRGDAEAARAAQRATEPLRVSGFEGTALARAQREIAERHVFREAPPVPAPHETTVTAGGLSDDAARPLLPEAPSKPTRYSVQDAKGLLSIPPDRVTEVIEALHAQGWSDGDLGAFRSAAQHARKEGERGVSLETANTRCVEILRRRWGADFEAELAAAKSEATELALKSPWLRAQLFETAAGSDPILVERLALRRKTRAASGRA